MMRELKAKMMIILVLPVLLAVSGYVYAKTIENGERVSKVEENCIWIREEFSHVRSDIKSLKDDLKEDLKNIKDDLRRK